MSKNTEEKNIAVVEENLPVAQAIGAMDFEEDAGAGIEGADSKSFAIPFLSLLQGLSPQIETVDGAKPGLYINTITNELYAKARVIPCAFQRRFLRWAPRSKGGGFKGEYNPIDVETNNVPGMVNVGGQYYVDVPEGTTVFLDSDGHPLFDRLSDTRNHYVLVESAEGSWQPALISMASTQIGASKKWISRIQGIEMRNKAGKAFNPPSFSHIYSLTSEKKENAKGKWNGVVVGFEGQVTDAEVYAKAKAFHAAVSAGEIEVSQPVDDVPAGDSSSDVNAF
jgi:hypothetical protein